MEARQLTKNAFFIALMITAITVQGCGGAEEVHQNKTDRITVEIKELQSEPVRSSKKITATLKSETRSEIGTKVMGEVEQVPFSIGDRVQAGSVILGIKDDDLRARKAQVEAGLEQVRAQMELAEKDYQRFKKLHEQGSATQREWDEVQTNYRATKAQVTSTENQLAEINDLLSYTQIKAPYDGVIAAVYVEEGDIASPGRPLIAIEKTGRFELMASVPETDIRHISTGDTLPVSIPSAGLNDILAVVSEVSASGDPVSRQFKVELKLLDSDREGTLRSGMYAVIHLSGSAGEALFIPNSAVVERGQLKGIYVISPGEDAVLRWIRTGAETAGQTEVLSGIREGERFVIDSRAIHFDGQPVSAIN